MRRNGVNWTQQEYSDYCKKQGMTVETIAPAILQKTAPEPNKTEAYFQRYLQTMHPGSEILFSKYTLRLGDDLRYTPDFCRVWLKPDENFCKGNASRGTLHHELDFYEVKNESRKFKQTELTKPILAATQYPWHTFYIAILRNGREWNIRRINAV